MGTMMHLL